VVAVSLFVPRGTYRMVPSAANGQPAFGVYQRGEDGIYRADAVKVLTIAPGTADTPPRISRISSFREPGLFAVFGLPEIMLPEATYEPVGPC
jgi:RNA polymerase sigma-70 factor (ECF subfamily)